MRRGIGVVCGLLLVGLAAFAQPAAWTTWELSSNEAFPSDLVWMIDNSLFVALHEPASLARFEPDLNRLFAWELNTKPGEFVWTNSGLLFTTPRDGGIGWLHPDANHVEYWALPSLPAEPVFALPSSFGNGVENMWFLDWATGRLGLFEPAQLAATFEEGPEPQEIALVPTARRVLASAEIVTLEMAAPASDLVPAVYLLEPAASPSFREWGIVTNDPPPYTFLQGQDGRVWVPDVVNQALLALSPSDSVVSVYELQADLFFLSLVAVPDSSDLYFTAIEDDARAVLGVLQPESGAMALWAIPGGAEIDPVSLIIAEDVLWFCDRGHSAVYRFVPMTGEFTWWQTGDVDDAPLFVVAGNPGEFWVSFEGTGKIARLRVPAF